MWQEEEFQAFGSVWGGRAPGGVPAFPPPLGWFRGCSGSALLPSFSSL